MQHRQDATPKKITHYCICMLSELGRKYRKSSGKGERKHNSAYIRYAMQSTHTTTDRKLSFCVPIYSNAHGNDRRGMSVSRHSSLVVRAMSKEPNERTNGTAR